MAQWFKNKKFARNISSLLPKVLYLWIIIMRYWEQKIIIKTFTSQFKKKMSYVLKQTKSINSHNTHIEKKASVEKKSHNFLVQNFQKKRSCRSTFYYQYYNSWNPPQHLTPPLLSGPRLPSHVQKTSQTNTAFYL